MVPISRRPDAVAPSPSRGTTRADRWLLGLSVATIAACALFATWSLTFPWQISYVEGFLLEQGTRLAHGGALYRPLGEPAWIVDNFPPLYPMLLAGLTRIVGPSFSASRLMTLLAVAGLGAPLVRWARRGGATRSVALGLAALWLASPWVLSRAVLVRMDLAALLLGAGGILGFLALHGRRPRLALIAASGLFLAALFTRQTQLAAPMALLAALWMSRRRSDAIRLAILLFVVGAAFVVLLQATSHGGFLVHAVRYNTGRWLPGHYALRTLATVALQLPLLGLGLLGGVAAWRSRSLETRALVLWGLLAALATLTAGKAGSTYNHYLEVLFVSALLAPRGLTVLARSLAARSRRHLPKAALLAALLLLQVAVTITTPPVATTAARLADPEAERALVARLAGYEGPVLSENAGAVILSGKELLWEPRTMTELALSSQWDERAFLGSVRNRTYDAVVTEIFPPLWLCAEGCRWTPDAWAALAAAYEPVAEYGRWRVWEPAGVGSG